MESRVKAIRKYIINEYKKEKSEIKKIINRFVEATHIIDTFNLLQNPFNNSEGNALKSIEINLNKEIKNFESKFMGKSYDVIDYNKSIIPKSREYIIEYNEDFKRAEQESYENFQKIIKDNKTMQQALQELEDFLSFKGK